MDEWLSNGGFSLKRSRVELAEVGVEADHGTTAYGVENGESRIEGRTGDYRPTEFEYRLKARERFWHSALIGL
jgi:hypothetical protein